VTHHRKAMRVIIRNGNPGNMMKRARWDNAKSRGNNWENRSTRIEDKLLPFLGGVLFCKTHFGEISKIHEGNRQGVNVRERDPGTLAAEGKKGWIRGIFRNLRGKLRKPERTSEETMNRLSSKKRSLTVGFRPPDQKKRLRGHRDRKA